MNSIFRPVASLLHARFLTLPQAAISRSTVWLRVYAGIFVSSAAWAQPPERDPLNTQTPALAPVYQSAFTDYKPYQDPELIRWKAANNVVREFGGMAAMGSMNEDTAEGSEKSAPPVQPAQDSGHTEPDPSTTSQPTTPPARKPADVNSMPGHDMSRMSEKNPPVAAPTPSLAPQPAAPATHERMPGHGGMSH